jgi:transcriptional regulator with XRE-family HTH domain
MTSGLLIREARLRAGLSQDELGARVGKDRAQIARWERGAVEPSFETLRELVRACGLELAVEVIAQSDDKATDERLDKKLRLSPHERVAAFLKTLKAE